MSSAWSASAGRESGCGRSLPVGRFRRGPNASICSASSWGRAGPLSGWSRILPHPQQTTPSRRRRPPPGVRDGGISAAPANASRQLEAIEVSAAQRAELRIKPGASPTVYSPMIFGGFLEHFDDQVYGGIYDPSSPLADRDGFRADVLEALRELKMSVIRWPGGCFASGYYWKGGVGPDREPADDMAWGVVEPNTFGTAEFVKLCRKLGARPYICNNAGNGTIQEMREWVEYCNSSRGAGADLRRRHERPEPLNVPIWSIGNENWGAHEIGHRGHEEWARLVGEAAREMLSADPDILLTAAAVPDPEWSLPLLREAGEYLSYISIHKYWVPNWGEIQSPSYLDCMMESATAEELILQSIAVLDAADVRGRVALALDEWNLRSWHHPGFPRKAVQDYDDPEVQRLVAARRASADPTQYTMSDALFSASFLNACLRHAEDVGMANIAPMVNTVGPLRAHEKGVIRRTSFHVLAMYASLLQPYVVPAEVSCEVVTHGARSAPLVDGVVTADERGQRLAVAVVNRHPSLPVDCGLELGVPMPEGHVDAVVLSGDSADACNDVGRPNRVRPEKTRLALTERALKVPPHSLVVLRS
ncbi:MAG: alpha-N-arabinofuranosidase [Armatimonadia bacterium]|nr:alpha-N-arabinofuranosidase [Armatimonadia bacterium]